MYYTCKYINFKSIAFNPCPFKDWGEDPLENVNVGESSNTNGNGDSTHSSTDSQVAVSGPPDALFRVVADFFGDVEEYGKLMARYVDLEEKRKDRSLMVCSSFSGSQSGEAGADTSAQDTTLTEGKKYLLYVVAFFNQLTVQTP